MNVRRYQPDWSSRSIPDNGDSGGNGTRIVCARSWLNGGAWPGPPCWYCQRPFRLIHRERSSCGRGYSGSGAVVDTDRVHGVRRAGKCSTYGVLAPAAGATAPAAAPSEPSTSAAEAVQTRGRVSHALTRATPSLGPRRHSDAHAPIAPNFALQRVFQVDRLRKQIDLHASTGAMGDEMPAVASLLTTRESVDSRDVAWTLCRLGSSPDGNDTSTDAGFRIE